MSRTTRSRGVSSYRTKKRSKRIKLSKRRNKLSNKRLNRKSFKRVSKRMRNNRKSFRRRGGAPQERTASTILSDPRADPTARANAEREVETGVATAAAEKEAAAEKVQRASAFGLPLVHLRCLGFQKLQRDPKTGEDLKSKWTGDYEKFYYLIMIAIQRRETSETEVKFIRRRWSVIIQFVRKLQTYIAQIQADGGAASILREIRQYSREILQLGSEADERNKQGLFNKYLSLLSNFNRRNRAKIIAGTVLTYPFFQDDTDIFTGKIEIPDVTTELNPTTFSTQYPENIVTELLDTNEGGARYSIECDEYKYEYVEKIRKSKYFYCIRVSGREIEPQMVWRRWSECRDLHNHLRQNRKNFRPSYKVDLAGKWVDASDAAAAAGRRAQLDGYFTEFAEWVNNVYRESNIDLMKNPTVPGTENVDDVVYKFFTP